MTALLLLLELVGFGLVVLAAVLVAVPLGLLVGGLGLLLVANVLDGRRERARQAREARRVAR